MRVSNKFWKGIWTALLIQLMVVILIMSTLDSAHAGKKPKPYNEHPKYRWVFCQVTPIPLKWCNRGRGRP